jgi:hypothetical protein
MIKTIENLAKNTLLLLEAGMPSWSIGWSMISAITACVYTCLLTATLVLEARLRPQEVPAKLV